MTPCHQLGHGFVIAGNFSFHTAIATIADPAGDAQPFCFLDHGQSVAHALDATANDEVTGSGGFLHADC